MVASSRALPSAAVPTCCRRHLTDLTLSDVGLFHVWKLSSLTSLTSLDWTPPFDIQLSMIIDVQPGQFPSLACLVIRLSEMFIDRLDLRNLSQLTRLELLHCEGLNLWELFLPPTLCCSTLCCR